MDKQDNLLFPDDCSERSQEALERWMEAMPSVKATKVKQTEEKRRRSRNDKVVVSLVVLAAFTVLILVTTLLLIN